MAISSQGAAVLDASFVVVLCALEADKLSVAEAELARYAQAGWRFYAPGVLVAEVLYVLCKKLAQGALSPSDYELAILRFETLLAAIEPSPNGEFALMCRAEQIRGSYSCRHSADGLYLALTERLASAGNAEMVTFDSGQYRQAISITPPISVRLLGGQPGATQRP